MRLDDQENYIAGNTKKGLPYLIIIVLLWMSIIFYIFTIFSDRVEKKAMPNYDDRMTPYQASPVQEPYTYYTARLDEVVLTRGPSGHYMHKGQINDEDVIFIIDTGASDISIPGHIAEQLELEEGEKIYFQTANGLAAGFNTVLDTVSIGDISLDNVSASINPNVNINYILLGMSFLKDVNFSQEDELLIIRQ